jgi:hypothetical protein
VVLRKPGVFANHREETSENHEKSRGFQPNASKTSDSGIMHSKTAPGDPVLDMT